MKGKRRQGKGKEGKEQKQERMVIGRKRERAKGAEGKVAGKGGDKKDGLTESIEVETWCSSLQTFRVHISNREPLHVHLRT